MCACSVALSCSPTDCSLPGSSVYGISQARILKWVAITSLTGSSKLKNQNPRLLHWHANSYHYDTWEALLLLLLLSRFSRVRLYATPQMAAHQAPPRILQARTLEWVAISFSNAWKWKVKVKSLSSVQFLATPWTAAHQAPLPMGFSRQEYWSGVPLPYIGSKFLKIAIEVRIVNTFHN